ncbi:MAG: metal-dependent hydrolase [Hyphomicrobium sp.]
MANFTTHIAAGTVVAGALATLTLAADVVAPENLIAVTMAGVLGSVLPDIDLKESRPSKAMFAGLGIFFSFAVLFSFALNYSIAELWILWLGTLVGVRYGLHMIFHRLAVHRGIWHSILAAAFSSIATAVVFASVLGRHEGVAWLAAGFMFAGYLVHLTLDEMYSVDVMDVHIKSSFGTALKLYDSRHPYASIAMAAAAAGLFTLTPPAKTFADGISSRDLWAGLSQRLLPDKGWFGIVNVPGNLAGTDSAEPRLTTGSIPNPAPLPPKH